MKINNPIHWLPQHSIKTCPLVNEAFIVINKDLKIVQLSDLARRLLNCYTNDLGGTWLDNLFKVLKSQNNQPFLNIWVRKNSGETLALTTCLHPLSSRTTCWFLVPQSRLPPMSQIPSPLPLELTQLLHAMNTPLIVELTPHGLIRTISSGDSPLIPVYLPRVQLLPIFELIHPSDIQQLCQFVSNSFKTGVSFKFKLRWIYFNYDHRYTHKWFDTAESDDGSMTRVDSYESADFDYEIESDITEDCSSFVGEKAESRPSFECEWVQVTCRPGSDGGELTLLVEPTSAPSRSTLERSPHIIIQLIGHVMHTVRRTFSLAKLISIERQTLVKVLVSMVGLLCQIDYFIHAKELALWRSGPLQALKHLTPSKCYELGEVNLTRFYSQAAPVTEHSSFWPILGLVVQLMVFRLPMGLWDRVKRWLL